MNPIKTYIFIDYCFNCVKLTQINLIASIETYWYALHDYVEMLSHQYFMSVENSITVEDGTKTERKIQSFLLLISQGNSRKRDSASVCNKESDQTDAYQFPS